MINIKNVVIATTNPRKKEELSEYLKEFIDCPILFLNDFPDIIFDDVEENGETYAENSKIKVKAAYEKIGDGYLIIADDSGIEIDALPNELGIHTARFVSKDTPYSEKTDEIIRRMKDITYDNRKARYHSAISALFPNGEIVTEESDLYGYISYKKSGEDYYGFDNIFCPNEYPPGITISDIKKTDKTYKSSRNRAVRLLSRHIKFYDDFETVFDKNFGAEMLYRSRLFFAFGFKIDDEKNNMKNGITNVYFTIPESYEKEMEFNDGALNRLIYHFKETTLLGMVLSIKDEPERGIFDYNDYFYMELMRENIKFLMKVREGEVWTVEKFKTKVKEFDKIIKNKIEEYKDYYSYKPI